MSRQSYSSGGGGGGGYSARNNNSGGGGFRGGRGGGAGGRGGGGPRGPNDGACFKCGAQGHISRDCPSPMSGPRGGGGRGRGGRGGGNLDINIDGRMKTDIWQILKEFQENPELDSYSFPPDLTNTDRRYIHTCCKNLNLTSKSTGGGKGSANRYVVVYKGAEDKQQAKRERKHPLSMLDFKSKESEQLVDAFLDAYPLPASATHKQLDDTEIDLAALAAKYTPTKTAGDLAALNAHLQQLYTARAAAQASAAAAGRQSELQSFRTRLPIYAQKETILRMIDENQVLVLSSSTGSGKSTQVPQYLLDHLDAQGKGAQTDMIVTQPRRISAMSLAQRVAQEREVAGEQLGDTVGYQIRLENCRSSKTRLLYCTIGVLLRRLSSDRLLQGISHIIVDEVHERDRLCDFLLVILRDLLLVRKDLKLILMSATLNADMFSNYFGACPHIHIEGFTFPVHTFYLEDVVELIGYTPPTLSKFDANRRRTQQDQAKEKKLADLLNLTLNSVLTLETAQHKPLGVVMNPPHGLEPEDDAADDEAALAALANIAAMGGADGSLPAAAAPAASSSSTALSATGLKPSNKVTGWTDTWTYQPVEENPFAAAAAAEDDAGAAAASGMTAEEEAMMAALAGIAGDVSKDPTNAAAGAMSSAAPATAASSASSSSASSSVAAAAAAAEKKKLHPSQISAAALSSSLSLLSKPSAAPILQNPLSGLKYSASTLESIAKIEEEGMDFIDYDLILEVIVFICQKFDASLLDPNAKKPAQQPKKGAANAARAAAAASADEDDDVNIYNGSILVFLPGWEDICKLIDMATDHPVLGVARKFLCLPLHGSISSQQQRLIFARPAPGQRKVIFSTNISETSITIDDVVFVIDSGKMKEKSYDAFTKMCALSSTWVSQANAKQRSGRAGRCRRGVCFRLYTTGMYNKMDVFQTPELLRTPLEELCLQVKLLKLGSIAGFLSKALQPPNQVSVNDATDLLTRLGALDPANESLTVLGEYLASMPLDPRLAKMILFGAIFKCLDPVLTIAACLSYRDPFVLPVQFERERAAAARQKLANGSHSDMLTLLNAYHGYTHHLARGGVRAAADFCRQHFLSQPTMQMITKLKAQFMDTLKETGWLDHCIPAAAGAQPGGAGASSSKHGKRRQDQSVHSKAALKNLEGSAPQLNVHQHNLSVLTAVICLGMYPMAAKVQVQTGAKKKRALLCTRNNLHNVCLHPSCVSCKDFRRCAAHATAWKHDGRIDLMDGELPLAGQVPEDSVVQYCVFFESMRSSEIFLRNVHWVQPMLLALFGTGNKPVLAIKHQMASKSSPSASPARQPKVEKRSKKADATGAEAEDAAAAAEDEDGEDEEDEEDEEYESESEEEEDANDDSVFHVDEWVRFTCAPQDAQRFVLMRSYLHFVLDSFIRRSGAHAHGGVTSAASVHTADQAVEFLVKLLSMELAPKGLRPASAHSQQHMQPQQQQQFQQHAMHNQYQQPRIQQRPVQPQQQPQQQWQSSPAQPQHMQQQQPYQQQPHYQQHAQQQPRPHHQPQPQFVPSQLQQQQRVQQRPPHQQPQPQQALQPQPQQQLGPYVASIAPPAAASIPLPSFLNAGAGAQPAQSMPSMPTNALSEAELLRKLEQLRLQAQAEVQQQQQQQRQHHSARGPHPHQQQQQQQQHPHPHSQQQQLYTPPEFHQPHRGGRGGGHRGGGGGGFRGGRGGGGGRGGRGGGQPPQPQQQAQ